MFTNVATSFLTMGYTRKYRSVVKDFYTNENAALAVRTFS